MTTDNSETASTRNLLLVVSLFLGMQALLMYFADSSESTVWAPLDLIVAVMIGGALYRYSLPLRRTYVWLAAVALIAVLLYGVALRVFPMFFGRALAGRYDVWLLGNLVDLVFDSQTRLSALLGIAGVALGLSVAVAVSAWLVSHLTQRLASLRLYPWLALGVASVLAWGLIGEASPGERRRLLASELLDELERARTLSTEHEQVDLMLEERRIQLAALSSDLRRIEGQSVFLFVVESYGEAIWKEPEYRALFEPTQRSMEKTLVQSGFHLASRFVRSPVRGGGSWFAHTTMMTGVTCDNPIVYERILRSRLTTMAAHFRNAGHHTINVAPAVDIPKDDWPDGKFFQFDERFWFEDFGYRGPRIGWSPIPDQFAVQSFHEKIAERNLDRPLFVDFTLTSSHSPFRWVPPYFEGNPSTEELAAGYQIRHPTKYNNSYHRLAEPARGYTESIRYSLQSVVDFAALAPMDDAIFIVVGDHQPMTMLKGTESHLVPLHVFSRDRDIVRRFLDDKFGPGLVPKRSRMRMQELLPLLLRIFST